MINALRHLRLGHEKYYPRGLQGISDQRLTASKVRTHGNNSTDKYLSYVINALRHLRLGHLYIKVVPMTFFTVINALRHLRLGHLFWRPPQPINTVRDQVINALRHLRLGH